MVRVSVTCSADGIVAAVDPQRQGNRAGLFGGIELEFVNANKIGGPWYDWDAIELAALLILVGESDINGAPNSSGGWGSGTSWGVGIGTGF
mgnify:CR=1 FL=1